MGNSTTLVVGGGNATTASGLVQAVLTSVALFGNASGGGGDGGSAGTTGGVWFLRGDESADGVWMVLGAVLGAFGALLAVGLLLNYRRLRRLENRTVFWGWGMGPPSPRREVREERVWGPGSSTTATGRATTAAAVAGC
jgi:hypothetical protein